MRWGKGVVESFGFRVVVMKGEEGEGGKGEERRIINNVFFFFNCFGYFYLSL